MASPSIELHQVSIEFERGEELLKNVNLKVEKGSSLVLIGPSGQGKTVLLKLMAGLLAPSEGEVLIEGQKLKGLERKKLQELNLKMGMLFQKNALFDSMTVGENVAFPLRETKNLSKSEISDKVDYFLKEVGIIHAKNLFPDEISGGMQKRLGIARALALDPEIIFYDDPTAGLDPITSRKIIQLILDLQKHKKSTLVAITNEMGRAYQLAGKIAMVVDHEVIITGSADSTRNHKNPKVHQFVRGELKGPLTESA